MKIEIVKTSPEPDDTQAERVEDDFAAEEQEDLKVNGEKTSGECTGGGGEPAEANSSGRQDGKRNRILVELKKALLMAIIAAVVVLAAPPLYRLCQKWAAARSEEKASAEDLYRRRVYAQRRLGGFRLRASLFGPSDWNRTFFSEEAKRWKRIAAAFENRSWAEAVPLLLGQTPPAPYPPKEREQRGVSRPFPSRQDIDRARDALVAELDARGRMLSGIQTLVGDLHPSPDIRVSDSAAPFVSGVEVAGRGVAELRLDLERRAWLGLANRLLDAKNELFPPFEPMREKLRDSLAKTEAILVCRSSVTNAELNVMCFYPNGAEQPHLVPLRDRLPDGSGWMVPWDLHVRDAFVLTPEMASLYAEKYAEMRNSETKRLNDLSVKLRLGSVSQKEFDRERMKGGAVQEAFLEWARSGKPEEAANKNALASAERVFLPLGRPNHIYANSGLAAKSPKFVPLGARGRDWKKMVGLHSTKDWAGIVRTLGASTADAPPNAGAIQMARNKLATFRIDVRMELAESDNEENFSGDVEEAEVYPDDSGYVLAFPVAQSELAVFLGDVAVLEDRLEEADEEWSRGIAGIRKRIELDEVDGEEAIRLAAKLANRIKRGFVAWLGEN